MGLFFYNIALRIYEAAIRLSALWNNKAKKWVSGRRGIYPRMRKQIAPGEPVIWMHCASLGEFEQGRPVLEEIRRTFPQYKLLLSFFSPSGFEIRKDYQGADYIFYLPIDSATNARRWMDIVSPQLVVFVKYEYWWHYIKECRSRGIPLLLISAIFRETQPFFKWYGGLFRKMISMPEAIFVQDEESGERIKDIAGDTRVIVAGDTRFDRVTRLLENTPTLDAVSHFAGNSWLLVAGSTWPQDESILKKAFDELKGVDLKIILAPHEVHEEGLRKTEALFPGAVRFSDWDKSKTGARVLIIDGIGFLSRVYPYASVTYIGGGFNPSGIHNVLEAAVYGKLVIHGPVYEKFREARELVKQGAGFVIRDDKELRSILERFLDDPELLEKTGIIAAEYVRANTGATQKIMEFIQENRLLTS